MGMKLLLLVLLIKILVAIRLEINIDENRHVEVSHEGSETSIVTDRDIDSFNLRDYNLKRAVDQHFGGGPSNVYVRSPTPWGDLYKTYGWEPVKRVLSVKSAKVTKINTVPCVVLSQDFENPSMHTIKVNAGLSRIVQNSLTTSWSKEKESVLSQEIDYGFTLGYFHAGGKTGFSFNTKMGQSEKKTRNETIGITSNYETELKPGTAIRSILMASEGSIEIEVVHSATLTGNVAVNYNPPYNGHHFYRIPIQDIYYFGGIKKEITIIETIRMECYIEAKFRVENLKIVGEVPVESVSKAPKKTVRKNRKEKVRKIGNSKVHTKTIEKVHNKTIEKVHNETLNKVHDNTVGKGALFGLLTEFDFVKIIVKIVCYSCKHCLTQCVV